MRRVRTSGTALVLAAVLVVGGCGAPIAGRAVRAEVPAAGAPLEWRQCNPDWAPDVEISDAAECAMLSVPLDYAKPDGDVAQLAMIRYPASGDRIGSLFVNPGGPGASGVDTVAWMASGLPDAILERFDIVGFDPRGVGSSTPKVWCNSDEQMDVERADPPVDYTPPGIQHVESVNEEFVQRCLDRSGRELLANVGTANVARDLDAMRAAVGDDQLTYLGYSYGTRIGTEYLEAFPDRVRAMVLDGAINPGADIVESNVRDVAAFQIAFDDYAADCALDADCPLGTDPRKATDVYRELLDPLADQPAKTTDSRGLSWSDAISGTVSSLYGADYWSDLTVGLTELREGRGDTLLELADAYYGRDSDGHYSNMFAALSAVNCVDEPPLTDRAVVAEQDRRSRAVAPFLSFGTFTGRAPLDACAFWPVPVTSTLRDTARPGLPPTLVVSTTHDPATPYEDGVELARQLGGALLTYDGTQHTIVFSGDQCVDDIAVAYLVDLAEPEEDMVC